MKVICSLIFFLLFPVFSFAAGSGVLGVCDDKKIIGDACFKFTKVDTLFNSPQILNKEDAVIFFACGLVMWVLGVKVGAIISAIKKAR